LRIHEECGTNKGLLHPKNKAAICLLSLEVTSRGRILAAAIKDPLINLISIVCKRHRTAQRSDEPRRNAVRSEVLCSKRASSCEDELLSSSLQARAKLS